MKALIFASLTLLLASCGGGEDTNSVAEPAEPLVNFVQYTVSGSTGTSFDKAAITYSDDKGATQQTLVALPWTKSFFGKKGGFLYVSAQNQNNFGYVSVEIKINSTVFKEASSTSPYGIATASGACC